MSVIEHPLGREVPPDFDHVVKFPATRLALPQVSLRPVIFGISWYSNFDSPTQDSDGTYWIGRAADWGKVRGGHAIGAKYKGEVIPANFVSIFNQNPTPRCVGYSISKALSVVRGKVFDPNICYAEAQQLDSTPGPPPPYDGTEVRAGFEAERIDGPTLYAAYDAALETVAQINGGDALSLAGVEDAVVNFFARHRPHHQPTPQPKPPKPSPNPPPAPDPNSHPELGIDAYYWCTDVDQIRGVLGLDAGAPIVLSNTWGANYPDVCISDDGVHRLLSEQGEAGFMVLKGEAAA